MNQTPASQLPGQVIAVNYNGTYYYYLRNAQGDVVKLIDKTGSTVVEYTCDSWGKLLSTSGSLAETFGAEQPFRYRGYVYDEETGWYYLQSRYYNPELGRFISADVYLSTGQGVLGHNAYAYCLNNPVNTADESGCLPYGLRYWGEIHRMVEEHIIEERVNGLTWHREVSWTVNRKGKKGIGKVDLIDEHGGMYEIKPAGSENMGVRQLQNYMLGEARDGSQLKVKEEIHTGTGVFSDSFTSKDGRYRIKFWCNGNGVILYTFSQIKKPEPVKQGAPSTNIDYAGNAYIASFSMLLCGALIGWIYGGFGSRDRDPVMALQY